MEKLNTLLCLNPTLTVSSILALIAAFKKLVEIDSLKRPLSIDPISGLMETIL